MFALELSLIVAFLLLALSIVWGSLKTGISPMMSSAKARKAMLAALDLHLGPSIGNRETRPIIDLGSGWGTLVIAAAKKYPEQQIIGYELSWFPWVFSVIRKHILRLNNLTIYRRDFLKADFSGAAVLFCYLFPGAMVALANKLSANSVATL